MNNQAKVDASIDLELADLLRANYWHFFSKWSIRFLMALYLLGAVGAAIAFFLSGGSSAWYPLVSLAMILMGVFLIAIVYLQTRRNFSDLKEFQKNVRYTFSFDGYDVSDEKSASHVSWDAILRAVETKHSFNLFFHRMFFHVVPKRCFRQPSDIQVMRDILRESLGGRAKVGSES
jgi:hypothetical protein